MTTTGPTVASSTALEQPPNAPTGERTRFWSGFADKPGYVAALVWLVCLPVAWQIPAIVGADPWQQRGAEVPLALGGAAALSLGAVGWWLRGRRTPALAGAAAGLFAAYLILVLRTSLHGTPFAYEGVYGDTARLSAMVTRYTVAWSPHDGIVGTVAAEYPPLFPWLAGKAAWLSGTPGWRMLQPAEILGTSLAVLVSFWMWLRATTAPAALAISVLLMVVFGAVNKVYEGLALALTVPWILLTLARPSRNRLHWAAAGVIGAVLVLTYYAYLVFAAIGLVLLVWSVARSEPQRRAYLGHVAKVAAVVLIGSAWWWVPYVWAMLHGGQQVGDMYQATEISMNPFPFVDMTPVGLMELVGLAGLLWYRGRTWWAGPLLLIVFGAYCYRVLGMLRWVVSAHSSLFYYTNALISVTLVTGLVLSVRESAPLARRLVEWAQRSLPAPTSPGRSGVVVVTMLLCFAGFTYWSSWMPANLWQADMAGGAKPYDPGTYSSIMARRAHTEPRPDGSYPRYSMEAPSRSDWFPTQPIQDAVESVLGRGARPSTLSDNDALLAFLPWNGYMDVDRNASLGPVRWDDRFAELMRLTRTHAPADFARASAHTRFGSIDVFVLHEDGDNLQWRPWRVPTTPTFQRSQFDQAHFRISELPGDVFLAVRIPRVIA